MYIVPLPFNMFGWNRLSVVTELPVISGSGNMCSDNHV